MYVQGKKTRPLRLPALQSRSLLASYKTACAAPDESILGRTGESTRPENSKTRAEDKSSPVLQVNFRSTVEHVEMMLMIIKLGQLPAPLAVAVAEETTDNKVTSSSLSSAVSALKLDIEKMEE